MAPLRPRAATFAPLPRTLGPCAPSCWPRSSSSPAAASSSTSWSAVIARNGGPWCRSRPPDRGRGACALAGSLTVRGRAGRHRGPRRRGRLRPPACATATAPDRDPHRRRPHRGRGDRPRERGRGAGRVSTSRSRCPPRRASRSTTASGDAEIEARGDRGRRRLGRPAGSASCGRRLDPRPVGRHRGRGAAGCRDRRRLRRRRDRARRRGHRHRRRFGRHRDPRPSPAT